ncbi:rhomboid family intramembrane serine protease [Spartinivicinus poritis]|uniref:Rhomboid family intramembrane serine protease n=1 Tax=Spartinivicinus poritis TaxID=2994640 RepID=A0ABT5U4R7_9GAMM|nr:rhomboid family intramembrane serine protease [Spartinivicinus sp. A2-2]MDE1461220.1 rhomboid family intramembrane serine protease [Spartinivicinus sp. A2-2]
MLIIPVEHQINWKNPPVATLLVILINCVIYFGYQIGDDKKYYQAMQYYEKHALYTNERDIYLQYLKKKDIERYKQANRLVDREDDKRLRLEIINDLGFDYFLKAKLDNKLRTKEVKVWIKYRQEFEALRNEASFIKFGIIPGNVTIEGMLGSIFMHGSIDHLLGNMIFLFILGYSLEIAFGRLAYLSLYMLTGVFANVLYVVLEWGEYRPGVGASGAIAGLMGMYVALYGARKIQFFYWVLFYFNYIKVPAFWVFPFWVGKELYGALAANDHVNYWAHLGGLLSGFFIVLATKQRLIKVDTDYIDKVDPLADYHQKIGRLEQLISDMKLDQARTLCKKIIGEYPDQLDIYRQYYNLLKNRPVYDDPKSEYNQLVLSIFKLPASAESIKLITDIFDDYYNKTKFEGILRVPKLSLMLSNKFINNNYFPGAEILVRNLMQTNQFPEGMQKVIYLLGVNYGKQGDKNGQKKYFSVLTTHFPQTEEAKLARMTLVKK